MLSAAALAGLDPGELAAATAVNQSARQLGAALGVAATVAALGSAATAPAEHFQWAWMTSAAFALVAAAAASRMSKGGLPGRHAQSVRAPAL